MPTIETLGKGVNLFKVNNKLTMFKVNKSKLKT